jgi:hypothetical protein
MFKDLLINFLKEQLGTLAPLLKPLVTALVQKVLEKVLAGLADSVNAGTLSLSNGVPSDLVEQAVNEVMS